MIVKFLPEPDQTKRNPHYRSDAPMKLYRLQRVEQIEVADQFKVEKEKTARRKQAAEQAIATKTAKTAEYAEKVEVEVPRMSKEQLIRHACDHYNDWNMGNEYGGDLATKDSDPLFPQRIAVNYLRHELTNYDLHLDMVYGKVGTADAYFGIRQKLFDSIAGVYPWLAEECKRQLGGRQ